VVARIATAEHATSTNAFNLVAYKLLQRAQNNIQETDFPQEKNLCRK
jgi:hypothetical protein